MNNVRYALYVKSPLQLNNSQYNSIVPHDSALHKFSPSRVLLNALFFPCLCYDHDWRLAELHVLLCFKICTFYQRHTDSILPNHVLSIECMCFFSDCSHTDCFQMEYCEKQEAEVAVVVTGTRTRKTSRRGKLMALMSAPLWRKLRPRSMNQIGRTANPLPKNLPRNKPLPMRLSIVKAK